LVAGFVVSLLVLQGLTFRHARDFGGNHSIDSVLISSSDASGELCTDQVGDDLGRKRDDCVDRHICCVSNARDGFSVALFSNLSLEFHFLPGSSFLLVEIADYRNREPAGWASSWSSRAPPSIS
jgi:hypothetical protein